jgi:hypothetical protein
MNDNYGQHGNEGPEHEHIRHEPGRPYWKRAHRDWRVWVGLAFMLTAMTIYIMSDNLAFLPHPPQRPLSGAAGK